MKLSLKFVPKDPIYNNVDNNVGVDNSLVPNRRQAIIWTDADPVHWRVYLTLVRGELIS